MCFEDDFLTLFRRGGGALCAESVAWRRLEKQFGPIYVSHQADKRIVEILYEKAQDPDAAFLMVLIGLPGTGKTLLLKELINGARHENFPDGCGYMIDAIMDAFEFRDVETIGLSNERRKKGDYPTNKRIVWVTTTVDDFVDISKEAEEYLVNLDKKLHSRMRRGESLIIFGNRGVLGDVKDQEADVIKGVYRTVKNRNRFKHFDFLRVPEDAEIFWIKQFGIKEPLFNLTSGLEGFGDYSRSLIKLACSYLHECMKKTGADDRCKICVVSTYQLYITKLEKMLENDEFLGRVHDLLFFLWLKHCDLYLTPRSLNLFWGYSLVNLWDFVEKRVRDYGDQQEVDSSLVYDAIFMSRIPSIRVPKEYSLTETEVHSFRDEKFESDILYKYRTTKMDQYSRRRERLRFFFEEDTQYSRLIGHGVLQEFMNTNLLISKMGQILKRLALERVVFFIGHRDETVYSELWDLERVLFAPIVELVEKGENGKIKQRLLAMIFDENLGHDISYLGFKEVKDDVRFFELREKVLELDIKVKGKSLKLLPRFYININDYMVLRELLLETGEPDLSLYISTKKKIDSFIRDVNGIVNYPIKTLLHDYLVQRGEQNNKFGLYVRTLEHGKNCDVEIKERKMLIHFDGEEYSINVGGRR